MSKKGSRASSRAVLVSAILLATCGAQAAAPSRQLTAFEAGAVERARAGAVRRLESERCRKLFTDFTDAEGRTLQRNLEEWGASPAEYVGLIPFLDGSRHPLCRKASIALVASPGVRRVYVCKAFADFQLRQPGVAESMVIHEVLHTLGLGENPPSSMEITQRVEARCR